MAVLVIGSVSYALRAMIRPRLLRALSGGALLVLAGELTRGPRCQGHGDQGVELFSGKLTLPPGDVAEAFGKLDPEQQDVAWPEGVWPAWGPRTEARGERNGWDQELPWRQWAELVRAEAAATDPERRGRLAHLARLQGRDADGWQHLARVGDAALVGSLLPLFLPGVAPDQLGLEAYPEGILLRPSLPPPADASDGTLRSLVGRPAKVDRIRIGESLISLQVVIEADGVQVDLAHLAGPPVELRLEPPVPPGVTLGLLYANWERVEDPYASLTLRLDETEELRECAVWGRFRPRETRWPRSQPGLAPTPRASLEIVKSGAHEPRLARFCEALEELFRRPCTLVSDPRARHGFFEPIRLHFDGFGEPRAFEHKFRSMISLAERWALAGTQARASKTLAGSKQEE